MANSFNKGLALIIGVGNDLPGTVTDAEGIYDGLIGNKKAGYLEENVHLLTGKSASRNGILHALDTLGEKVTKSHSVIIYYSGHGGHLKKTGDFFLVPNDFNAKDLENTTVNSTELLDRITKFKSKKFFLILDCCHAAGMTKSDKKEEENTDYLMGPGFKSPVKMVEKFGLGRRNFVLSSCRDNEKSYILKKDKYSLFTQCLIEVLEGKQNQNEYSDVVTIIDLLKYVITEVPIRSKDKQHPYVNKLDDVEIDFPIASISEERRKKIKSFLDDNKDNDKLKERLTQLENKMDEASQSISSFMEKRQQLQTAKEQVEVEQGLLNCLAKKAKFLREQKEIMKKLKP
jgi:hypothetical protein